jgi:hypothetical protein
MYIIIVILVVLSISWFCFERIQKGLDFEEYCAARIQKNHNEQTGEFLEIGQCRLILRTIVQKITELYPMSQMGKQAKLLNLRSARIIAVSLYEGSECNPHGGGENFIITHLDHADQIVEQFVDGS